MTYAFCETCTDGPVIEEQLRESACTEADAQDLADADVARTTPEEDGCSAELCMGDP
jgi:hypothetical protein